MRTGIPASDKQQGLAPPQAAAPSMPSAAQFYLNPIAMAQGSALPGHAMASGVLPSAMSQTESPGVKWLRTSLNCPDPEIRQKLRGIMNLSPSQIENFPPEYRDRLQQMLLMIRTDPSVVAFMNAQ